MKLLQMCRCKDFDVMIKYLEDSYGRNIKTNDNTNFRDSILSFIHKHDSLKNENESNYNFNLNTLEIGHKFILSEVYFDKGDYKLNYQSLDLLDQFIIFLRENPGVKIEIGGHTDDEGEESSNLILSINRARSVYLYFLVSGIKSDRMEYFGFGESRPIVENSSAENRALNRRTEIILISK